VSFQVEEEVAYYDPEQRISWPEGGAWPHANHGGFAESVVAAHFVLLGYHVLTQFSSTGLGKSRSVTEHSTALLHAVVRPTVSEFFRTGLSQATAQGAGQPDLFVFREETPNDPKIVYRDPRRWFFVEVKGPGDRVRPNQKAFWRAVAERTDLGLGPEHIRLFRTAPDGEVPDLKTLEY
jgi:hypothetical protein